MADYYLQRPAGFWEQVDEYTFSNWKLAVAESGDEPRYNGNWISVENGKITLGQSEPLTPRDFALIAKFTGGAENLHQNITIPGGIVRDPEFVQFIKKAGGHTKTILKKINGPLFVAQAA